MSSFTKKDAIRIVVDCAEQYRDNLLDRSLLFILSDKYKNTSFLEVSFRASNFLHLTGLKILELPPEVETSNGNNERIDTKETPKRKISATEFFRRCLDHELNEEDFEFAKDGTTELKLKVLPMMMSANLGATSVGDYNNAKPKLYTEKLAGGVKGCMGFCKDSQTHWMVPDTVLNEDIRQVTNNLLRIIATYRKQKSETTYSERVYIHWRNIYMSRRNIQIFIVSILIALTLGFIWGNSLLPSEQSSEISGSVMEFLEDILERIVPGYSPSAETGDTLIRKLAHFTEFMLLGIELTVLIYRLLRRSLILPPFCGLLAAVCDETLQLFSEGRSSQVTDVWIDFGGVLIGFLLVLLISRIRQRSRSTRNPQNP